jgi:hypothetical protein
MRIVLKTAPLTFLIFFVSLSHSGVARADSSTSSGDGGDTVTVGVSTGSSAGAPGGSDGQGSGSGGGSSGPTCNYTPVPAGEDASLGIGGATPGWWYEESCGSEQFGYDEVHLVWIADGTTPPPQPVVDPLSVALQAERSIHLPEPGIELNPSAFSVVNLPTWLWILPSTWHPYSVSASVGGVRVTATATPSEVTWDMGDGSSVTCPGPGTPYVAGGSSQTDCSHVYRLTSAGQTSPDGNPNDAAFTLTATITWSVRWVSSVANQGGDLPDLSTAASRLVRVEQIQSIQIP